MLYREQCLSSEVEMAGFELEVFNYDVISMMMLNSK